MSALARLMKAQGYQVSGSDRSAGAVTDLLISEGIAVNIGHTESVAGQDVVVYTCGVPADNAQLKEAARLNIPVMERAALLGLLSLEYEFVIAVAGTHGKTTTAAMIAHILAEEKPTLHIGAQGSLVGEHKLLITEACEYCNSFLALKPDLAVILNIECDHPDFYRTPESLTVSFSAFASRVREDGKLLVHESAQKQVGEVSSLIFGAQGDYAYGGAVFEDAKASFDVYRRGVKLGRVSLKLAGAQWIADALAAIAVCLEYGKPWRTVKEGIESFTGVRRRWEYCGECGEAEVVLDYAHHPTQIASVIDTVRLMGKSPLVIFQPHTYSRTKALWFSYVEVLKKADVAVLLDVYAAREQQDRGVTSPKLAQAVGEHCVYAPHFRAAADYVRQRAFKDTVILVLGAGDVDQVVPLLTTTVTSRSQL